MRLLGGRWRLLILSYLLDGPKRFSELRSCIPAISNVCLRSIYVRWSTRVSSIDAG